MAEPNIPAMVAAARRFLAEMEQHGGLPAKPASLLRIKQVATHYGRSDRWARQKIKASSAGQLIDGCWYIAESDLHLLGNKRGCS